MSFFISSFVYCQLVSIKIISDNPVLPQSTLYHFRAIGVFADGHSENITTVSNWSSSNSAIVQAYSPGQAAPFGSSGIASGGEIITGSLDGTAIITVANGVISGSTIVTVSSDIDGDGVLNTVDNCILTYNPLQEDFDADLKGDTCDCSPSTPEPGTPYANSITIYAFPSNSISPGQTATFYATVSNINFSSANTYLGVYQWTKNDVPVGIDSSIYEDATLVTGDVIKCTLSTGIDCVLGGSQTSNPIVLTVGILNTNESNFNNENIKAFPNPTQNSLNIQSSSTIFSTEIIDTNGRTIQSLSQNSNDIILDIENFQSGIYLLKVATENGTSIQKIIKK